VNLALCGHLEGVGILNRRFILAGGLEKGEAKVSLRMLLKGKDGKVNLGRVGLPVTIDLETWWRQKEERERDFE